MFQDTFIEQKTFLCQALSARISPEACAAQRAKAGEEAQRDHRGVLHGCSPCLSCQDWRLIVTDGCLHIDGMTFETAAYQSKPDSTPTIRVADGCIWLSRAAVRLMGATQGSALHLRPWFSEPSRAIALQVAAQGERNVFMASPDRDGWPKRIVCRSFTRKFSLQPSGPLPLEKQSAGIFLARLP